MRISSAEQFEVIDGKPRKDYFHKKHVICDGSSK